MKAKIALDLSDLGLGHAIVETAKDVAKGEEIDTSSFGVPIATALMVQPAICGVCGGEHYEHQGLTLELAYPTHKAFRKLELWERQAYKELPRRLEYMPVIDLEFCHDCFAVQQRIEDILALIHPAPAGIEQVVVVDIEEL